MTFNRHKSRTYSSSRSHRSDNIIIWSLTVVVIYYSLLLGRVALATFALS